MEAMFRDVIARLIRGIVFLTMIGAISWWTIDMQRKAAAAKQSGLISLTRINRALFSEERTHRR